MTWVQDQRIAYIKERIEAGHHVTRGEVARKFYCTIQTVTATFIMFKVRYPGLMVYDAKGKGYCRKDIALLSQESWKDRAEAAERQLLYLNRAATWLGTCGHIWDRTVDNTERCPRCKLQDNLRIAKEGLRRISNGGVGRLLTDVEAQNLAGTTLLLIADPKEDS